MEEYLAKSMPKESLEEHTLKLLKNYNLLKAMYPNLRIDWELLKQAVIYHDMGKINDYFQKRIRENTKKESEEIHHGHLSVGFVDYKNLPSTNYKNEKLPQYDSIRASLLAAAIYFHHNRDNIVDNPQELKEKLKAEINNLKEKELIFNSEELKGIRPIKFPSGSIFDFNLQRIFEDLDTSEKEEAYVEYVKLKGLLNKIDYAASAHENVELPNNFLEENMEKTLEKFKEQNPNSDWNDLQKFMEKNKDKNIVAIAQTGMGKTEAGLLWIGNNKGFFTLPLKTAINSIYNRVIKDIKTDLSQKVGLLHSDIASQYLMLEEKNEIKEKNKTKEKEENLQEVQFDLEDYIIRTRQLSMPLTICTIDQIFDFVYKYFGSELKLATLSYSKVIIDEIQMYNPELIAVILIALKWITKAGGKFSILTATMPPYILDKLDDFKIPYIKPKPFLNNNIRHSIKVLEENINAEFILEKYNDNKVLVICNTVKQAQKLYKDLSELVINQEKKIRVFHSSFIKSDRQQLESEILNFTKEDNKEPGIWICTQVVEASLDIDFDVLFTELSDINGLFQRMGRCYRKRLFTKEGYNCYVFAGDDKAYPSGINYVIDSDIFGISREEIIKFDGKISELDKQEIIDRVYTSEKINATKFGEKNNNAIDFLNSINPSDLEKPEVLQMFRNINSIDIIPRTVYEKNKDEIIRNIEILKTSPKDYKDIKTLKKEKIKANQKLQSFTVSIPYNLYSDHPKEQLEIKNNWKIPILDIEYDEDIGIIKSRYELDITSRIV